MRRYRLKVSFTTDRELTHEELQRLMNEVYAQIEEPAGKYPEKRATYATEVGAMAVIPYA